MPEKKPAAPAVQTLVVRAVLKAQAVVTAVAAVAALLLAGVDAALAAATGGGVGLATTAFYAWRAFAGEDGGAGAALRAFNAAEAQKIVLTVILFVVAIKGLGVSFIPMILAYMATLAAYGFGLVAAWPRSAKTK